MYKALVRPHMDYCDIIYHIPPNTNLPPIGLSLHCLMEKVEQIQYQGALAVTGAWQGSNCIKLYEEIGWETLSDRRLSKLVLQMHKIIDGKTRSYLREKLAPNRQKLINLPNNFQEVHCRTDRYTNSSRIQLLPEIR